MSKKKVAFLVPSKKPCGVNRYSKMLLSEISALSKNLDISKTYFDQCNNPTYYFNLARKLSATYDLIHIQHEFSLFGKWGNGFFWFLLGINKPLIVTFHEFHVGLVGTKEKLLLFLLKVKISKVIVLSKEAEKLAEHIFCSSKIINTGFGVKKQKITKFSKRLVVHPGFIRPNKNQLFTVELARSLPEFSFILAGEGKGEYFERVLAKANNVPNISIKTGLSDKEYSNLISKSKFVVLPYTSVVQSAVFFEALSMNKKIVASNLTFFKDFSQKKLLVTSKLEVNSFANILRKNLFPKKIDDYIKRFNNTNSIQIVASRNVEVYIKELS